MDEELEFNRLLRSAAILVVDDEPGMRNFLKKALESRCALLEVAASAEEAESLRLRYQFDLLLVDIRLPGLSGLDWLSRLRERGVQTHVIYMTAYADLDMAVGALRNGAGDFIMKPFRTEQVFLAMRRALLQSHRLRENALLRLQLEQGRSHAGVLGESRVMQSLQSLMQQVAPSRSPVLISGATGTGKSMLAGTLHALSRRQGAFIEIDTSSADDGSGEASVFAEHGPFAQADQGTICLDWSGEVSEGFQSRLLNLLEHSQLPSRQTTGTAPLNIRWLVTTTRDLQRDVSQGLVNAGLYHRLSALTIRVPALQERGDDLRLLTEHFMQQLAIDLRVAPVELLHHDWQQLRNHSWPGNVRELRNVVERILIHGCLPEDCLDAPVEGEWDGRGYPLSWSLAEVEREHIEAVLESVNNNKSAAARILGVSRKTLERKEARWYGMANES